MGDADLAESVARLDFLMPRIMRRLQRIPTEAHGTPSLPLPQLRMLALLELEGEVAMGELARLASVTTSTATASVQALVRGRYVERRRAEHDRRVVLVSLSERGREVLAKLHQQRRERFRTLLAHLPRGEQRRLVRAFETILDVVRKLDQAEAGQEG
ncbi:MAG: MarR family winged helix-turn-helix transcriptional regulator [Candidatus Brocadiia bacterium]